MDSCGFYTFKYIDTKRSCNGISAVIGYYTDFASGATIAGSDENIDFDTKTLVTIYNLMPQKVKDLCASSYKDIAPRIERTGSRFTYQGVTITPVKTSNGTDLKFSYGGHVVVVKNYTKAEFDNIFGF